ncbi:hypothetical protein ACXM0N_16390 [Peribacillus simplex]
MSISMLEDSSIDLLHIDIIPTKQTAMILPLGTNTALFHDTSVRIIDLEYIAFGTNLVNSCISSLLNL